MSSRGAATAAAVESAKRDRREPSQGPFLKRLLRDPLITIANSKFLLAGMLLVILAAGTISQVVLEDSSWGDGLWWAIVTASTVGYGDISPHTAAGRLVAGLMIGTMVLLLVPLVTAQILSRLVEDRNAYTHEEQEGMKAALASNQEELRAVRADLATVLEILAKRETPDK